MTKKFMIGLSAFLLALFSLFGFMADSLATNTEIRIGVLAYRGNETALREWQGHAYYLNQQIPEYQFRIVPFVIGLAGAFRRRVVAEGVETEEHGTLLLKLGCEWGQGFGIARPMPAADLEHWMANWQQPAAWRLANRWPSSDLPLLTVEIDHVRWIQQMEAVLMSDDGASQAPPTDPRDCRFGQWLNGDGKARYSGIPAFEHVVQRHLDAHRCGQELLTLRAESPEAARSRIGELYRCRMQLLESLHQLHRVVIQQAD